MRRLLLVIATGFFVTQKMNAQTLNCNPDDLADMFRRNLIIEFADTNEAGRGQITRYPQKTLGYLIKEAAEEYWKVNAKFEFESQGEVKRNLDRGEARNVYMFLTQHPDSKPGSVIWILNYTRGTAHKEGKPDYQIYLPDLSKRTVQEFTKFDIEWVISVMQEHMKHMQKSKKKMTPVEYFTIEAAKECKIIKSKNPNVLVDQGYLSKSVDEKDVRKSFRRLPHSLLTTGEINSILASESKDTCALIIVYPGKFESLSTSAMGEKYIFWNKVLVYGANYHVLGVVGGGRKDNVLIDIEKTDLVTLIQCD
ncbi:MAG: hypothetical protein GC180_07410 [Bacteroidetes bacterium]|nr:hypothetical protein [Bacteroidota bacterium]